MTRPPETRRSLLDRVAQNMDRLKPPVEFAELIERRIKNRGDRERG
jgi:hypothetical protein